MNLIQSNIKTMNSLDLLDVVNQSRSSSGENPHEPRKFLAKVEDELDDLTGKKFRLNNNQSKTYYYDLTIEQCMLVGMRESKSVRRMVLDKIKELETPQLPQTYAAALLEAGRLAQALEETSAKLIEAQPKVEYHDTVLDSTNGITTSEIAAELGMSAQKLNKILAKKMIQKKVGGRWLLRVKYLNQGYDTEATYLDDGGNSRHAMKWTEKGRKFIYGLIEGVK